MCLYGSSGNTKHILENIMTLKKSSELALAGNNVGVVDLGLNLDDVPEYAVATDSFKLDVEYNNTMSMPQLKCTDKGKIYLKNKQETQSVGGPSSIEHTEQSIEIICGYIAPTQGRLYAASYDPSNPRIDCYSNRGVAPSKTAKTSMHSNCNECPMAQWTKDSSGKDKAPACKRSRAMAVFPIVNGEILAAHSFRVSQVSERHSTTVKKFFSSNDFESVLRKFYELGRQKNISPRGIVVEACTVSLPPNSGAIGQVWAFRFKRWATQEEIHYVDDYIDSHIEEFKNTLYGEDSVPSYNAVVVKEPLAAIDQSVAFFDEVG